MQRNSLTSPYLWLLTALTVVPSLVFWNDTLVLQLVIVGFVVLYTSLYLSIVRFRSPRWLVLGQRQHARIAVSRST